MMLNMFFPTVMGLEMKTSKSPMTILLIILFFSWFLSIDFIMMGKDLWSMIFLIMLFNGGLMITYLFVISMTPKEKKSKKQNKWKQMIIILIMIFFPTMKTEKMLNDVFNITIWMVVLMTLMISMISMFIFLVMMDPFKSIKTSF